MLLQNCRWFANFELTCIIKADTGRLLGRTVNLQCFLSTFVRRWNGHLLGTAAEVEFVQFRFLILQYRRSLCCLRYAKTHNTARGSRHCSCLLFEHLQLRSCFVLIHFLIWSRLLIFGQLLDVCLDVLFIDFFSAIVCLVLQLIAPLHPILSISWLEPQVLGTAVYFIFRQFHIGLVGLFRVWPLFSNLLLMILIYVHFHCECIQIYFLDLIIQSTLDVVQEWFRLLIQWPHMIVVESGVLRRHEYLAIVTNCRLLLVMRAWSQKWLHFALDWWLLKWCTSLRKSVKLSVLDLAMNVWLWISLHLWLAHYAIILWGRGWTFAFIVNLIILGWLVTQTIDLTDLTNLSASVNLSNLAVCLQGLLTHITDSAIVIWSYFAYLVGKLHSLIGLFRDYTVFVHVGGAAHVCETPHDAAQIIGLVKW